MNILPLQTICKMAKQNSNSKKIASKAPVKPLAAAVPGLPGWLTNSRLQAWLVFCFGFLLYANTLSHQYTQDDAIVITDNMFTTQGLAGIPGILQYDTFYGFFKEAGKANLVAGGRYRPLTLVLFAFEYQLFGLNPFVGHLINALLYGLTGFVLFWLVRSLFRPERGLLQAHFVALAASLLFIAHPIHTEAVANIKGRDEIVALLCSLAALFFSLQAFFTKKISWQFAAGGLFFLALLSKENAITFVAIAPLTYWFFTKASGGKIVLQALPFLISAGLFLLIRTTIIGLNSSEPPLELMNNPFIKLQGDAYVPFTAQERWATILFTLGKYLQLLCFPHPLTHDYYPRQIAIMTFGDWRVLLSLLLYLALVAYAIIGLRKKDPIAYGIGFYLISLSIVSNIIFPVGTNMAERLLFMPSVGFCVAIAAWMQNLTFRKKLTSFGQLYPALGVLVAITLLFSLKTITRNPAWKDNYTLFTTDIQTSYNSAKLRNAVGGELVTRSVNEKNEQARLAMLREAAGHLQEAIKIHPTYKNAYLLLGNCYNFLQEYEASAANYRKALALDPDYQDAFNNLALTLRQAGRFYGEQKGDLPKAIGYLKQAYDLNPQDVETMRLLGVAYGISGNVQQAIVFFTKCTEIEPQNATAWYDLGTAYHNAGDPVKGNEYIQKALQLEPDIEQKRLLPEQR